MSETAEERTAHAAQAGMFLPFTEAPRTDTQRAFATAQGGYEGAREVGCWKAAEVTVWGPIAVRVGVAYSGARRRGSPERAPEFKPEPDRSRHRPSIGVFYKPEGFTEGEGEIEA